MNKIVLFAPVGYRVLTPEEKFEICNACGAKGGFPVPNTFYGLDISEACNIHDFMYFVGKTLADKMEADRVFLNNLIRIIDARTSVYILKKLRYRRAKTYFEFVDIYGASAYWKDKNLPENMMIAS